MTRSMPPTPASEEIEHHRVQRRRGSPGLVVSYRTIAIVSFYALLTLSWFTPFLSGILGAAFLNSLRQAGYTLIFGLALVGSGAIRRPGKLLDCPLTIMLAVGFCWLSVLWSLDPGNSLRKLFLTTMILSTVFLLVRALGYEDSVKALRRELSVLILISYVVVAVAPGLGIHQISEITADDLIGDWKGVFGHKNIAGPAATFLIMTLLFTPTGMRRWQVVGMLLVTTFFLYKTGSKTALALASLCMVIGFLTTLYERRFRALPTSVFLVLTIAATAYVWMNWAYVSAPLLDEEALTGRGAIWSVVVAFWQDHQMGAGFGSFWNISGFQPVDSYTVEGNWVADQGSSHNGYLELLVTVGPIGLALAILAFALSPIVRILSSANLHPRRRGYLVAMVAYALMANFTETTLLDRDQPVHVMLSVAIALISVALQHRQTIRRS